MSQKTRIAVPPPVAFKGGEPKQAAVAARLESAGRDRQRHLAKLGEMEATRQKLAEQLPQDLESLTIGGSELERLYEKQNDRSVLARIVRPFNRHSIQLRQRSLSEDLRSRQEAVEERLSTANQFLDDLAVHAARLHRQIKRMHLDLDEIRWNKKESAKRVAACELALVRLEAEAEDEASARLRYELEYERRAEEGRVRLLRAAEDAMRLEATHSEALLNSAQDMHSDLQVLNTKIGSAVRLARNQIDVLGVAADASQMLGDLHASLEDLDRVRVQAENYIDKMRIMLTEEVPAFSRELDERANVDGVLLLDIQAEASRERDRAKMESELWERAQSEVDSLVDDATKGDEHDAAAPKKSL